MNRRTLRVAAIVLMGCSTWVQGQNAQVSDLIVQLKDRDAGARARAAISLSALGAKAKPAVPALTTALSDNNLNVRYCAGNALKSVGPDAKSAVPALIAALKTFPGGSPELEGPARYYPDVRSIAAEALGAIGPAASAAIPALKEATADKSADVREAAADAIKKIGTK
jgi:HEAT repeat protein